MFMASREWSKSKHQPQVSGTRWHQYRRLWWLWRRVKDTRNGTQPNLHETNRNKPFQANEERKKKQEDSRDCDCEILYISAIKVGFRNSTVYYASETSGGFSETILSDSETTRRTRYRRAILQKTWFDLHSSSVFWLKIVSWKMLRFVSGCNPCSVSLLETSRIAIVAYFPLSALTALPELGLFSQAKTLNQVPNAIVGCGCIPTANISTHVPPRVHSVSTPMSLHAHEPSANISNHVPPQVHSVSTPMSLHAHEPSANISTHVPPQVHSVSTPMSLHAHEPSANISTHVPPQVHSVSTPMSLHAHEPSANISTHVPPQVHSVSTPMSLHAHEPSANISTHVPPQVHSVSTPMSLHAHEPSANISTHVPPQVHSVSTPMSLHAYEPSANISNHVPPQVHSVSTPMSLHAHEPSANISTHVPPQVHSLSTPMSLHAHEPSANISTHVPPQVHSVSTPMSCPWRWSMKNALSRTLSHPPPPLHPPPLRTHPNQHPASQHLCHVNGK